MFCHRCGKKIEDGSAFCLYCGTKMPVDDSINNQSDSDRVVETDNCDERVENVSVSTSVSSNMNNTSSSIVPNDADIINGQDSSSTENIVVLKQEQETFTGIVSSGDNHKLWTNNGSRRDSSHVFSIPKFYHDVNINLGKSTVACIAAILLVVLLCVCIVTCSNSNNDSATNSQTGLFEDSTEKTTPDSYETNEERWDAGNCIYSNFKYGVAFSLPQNMAWHKVSGTAKHTVVKFVQPDTQLTLFVNINPIEGSAKVTDIWDVYEEYTSTIQQLVKGAVNRNSAEQIEDYTSKKADFCGKHAVKTRYTSILGDDRHDEKMRITTIDYTFFYNNSTTTVTVKCYDEIIDFFNSQGIAMEDFLKSFQLTPISQ